MAAHNAFEAASGTAQQLSELSEQDVALLRDDTLSAAEFLHFDNAGASPLPLPVYRVIDDHLQREARLGGYEAGRWAEAQLEGLYASIAALINADPGEIAFAESATRAWDMAFYGVELGPGDRILIGRTEYSSNYLAMLHRAQMTGAELVIIPDGEDGAIDLERLAAEMDERVKLVCICHVPTSNGLVNDAEAVGRILKEHAALYMLDACQSVGQIGLDVERIGCDVLTGTGRKFLRGPRGTGFLYIRQKVLEQFRPPFVDIRASRWVARDRFEWRDDARRFESWESPMALRLGLKAAVDYALGIGLDRIEARTVALAGELRKALAADDRVTILDRGTRQSAIVTFATAGNMAAIFERLRKRGLMCGLIESSDARLDLEWECEQSALRLSPHAFNTFEECREAARILHEEIALCV